MCGLPPTQTRDQDGPTPIPSGANPSCGSNSSRKDPPVVEGVGDVGAEAYPISTFAKDALGVPSSICPTADTPPAWTTTSIVLFPPMML